MMARHQSYRDIRQYIKDIIGSDTLKDILAFVTRANPRLWR
jgi:hypothetical protein